MASIEKAAILGGVFANRQDTKSSPTNLHIISGEVAEKSEDGTVSILMDGLVYSAEDSQYIEIDTIGGLEEGDSATILLSGENGHAMTPLALGSIGSVDRVVEKIDLVVDDLEANYAHITEGVIDNARIDQADVNGLSVTYATINSLEAEEARVDGLLANKANVSDLTAATARIGTIEADYIKSDDMEAEEIRVNNLLADKADVSDLNAATARIGTIEADYIKSDDMEAEEIRVNNLLADKADVTDLTAATGRIGQLETDTADISTIRANSAKVQNLTAAQLEADHATIGSLDTNYARIDMANVNNAWIANGVIKDAAITNEMVADISANKLTAGTINGSVINVTNLNADNLTVGTINGARIGEGSLSLSKLDEAVYTESEVDSMVTDLNNRIDAQIETWTVDSIPTLNNTPASAWNTDKLKSEHVGDICYVINASSNYDGYTYRFAYDNTAKVYKWVLIKDNQVTAALGRISDLENFESTTSTWIEQTDEGLSTIRSNHTTLAGIVDKTIVSTTQLWFTKANTTAPSKPTAKVTSTSTAGNAWRVVVPAYNASYPNYYYCYQWEYADGTFGWSAVTRDISMGETQSNSRTALTNAASAQSTADTAAANASSALTQVATKVESSTFNTLKNTVDENSADITTLTTITENNGLTSTTNITNTVNTVSQTASGNSSKISQLATTLGTNADGTTKEGDIVHRTSAVEQDLDGFKTTVSNTYATKTEAYQTARPNLGPFLGYPAGSTDYFATVTYPIYSSEARTHGIMAPWEDRAGYVARQEDDAWLYIDYDFSSVTSGNTYINFITKKQTWLKPSTLYTVLVEWRDDGSVIPSGKGWRVYWTNDTGCFPAGYATGSKTTPTDFEDRYEVTSKDTSGIEAASYFARSYVFMNNSVHLKGWLRVSLYEGSYEGPYKPYAGAQLFATGSDLTSITERVTQAESIIEQHSDSIALKANSADVYTKQQSDGLISTEVTNRNAAITEATDAINLSVSEMYSTKTEAYQTARPNLAPISAAPLNSIYNATTNPNGYWKTALSPWYTQLEDGWVHVYKDNSEGTEDVNTTTFRPRPCPSVVPGETYTILIEVRNNHSTAGSGNTDMYIQQTSKNQFWGSGGGNIQPLTFGEETVIHSRKVADTAHLSGDPMELFRYNARCAAGSVLDFEFRLSLYEGSYDGPYKPYAGPQIFATQAELKVTADGISSEVSKKTDKDTIISTINQSAEEIQIQASKVAIDGTAIFSAIQDDVDDAITDKGYQNSSQVESAITSKGYATTTQAQGYANTAEGNAKTYVDGKGYQTAADVSTAVASGTSNLASKANAVKRTQRIYYRSSSSTKPTAMPTAWVTETGDKWAANATTAANWSTKVTPIANGTGASVTKYLYLWTCEQREMADGTLAYTNVLLDDSTTVIDGGKLITGSVSANSINADSGTFNTANIPELTANHIKANVINAVNNGTGTINADKINVSGITIGQSQVTNLSSALDAKADESDIPTKVSELTNDSNFATQSYVDDIQVGGRNLLPDTEAWGPRLWDSTGSLHGSEGATISDGILSYSANTTGNSMVGVPVEAGVKYTLSVDVRSDTAYTYDTDGNQMVLLDYSDTEAYHRTSYAWCFKGAKLATEWARIFKTFTVPDDAAYLFIRLRNVASNPPTYQMRHMKLERGNKPTDWSPAPEDETVARRAIYSTCSTAAGTAAKVVACEGFELVTGARITIKFTTANTAAAPTLNVNNTGAVAVWYNNVVAAATNPVLWGANATLSFVYDGTHWILNEKPPAYSVACSTAADTRVKEATVAGALVVNGTTVQVLFSTANTYVAQAVQFKFSGTAATNIYRDRAVTSASHTLTWKANTVLTLVRNAQYWYLADNGTRTMSEEAAQTATNFITSINDDGIWVTPSDAKPASDGKVTDSTSGWHISSVLELIKSGVNVFKVWLEGVITKVRIGQADSGHIIIDNDSVDIMNDSSELASFGADGADFMGGLVTLRANAESTIVDDVTYASSDGSIYGRSSEVEGSAGIATSLTTEQRQDGTTSTARSSIEAIPSGSENTASAKIEAYSTYDTDDGRSGHVLLRGDDLIFQSGSAASEEKVIPMNKMFRTYDFVSWESGTANRHLVVAAGICHCYFQGGSNARGNNHVLFTLPAECIPKVEKHVPFTVNAASGNTFAGGHAVINPTTGVCSVSQIYPTGIQGRIYINATWPVV